MNFPVSQFTHVDFYDTRSNLVADFSEEPHICNLNSSGSDHR